MIKCISSFLSYFLTFGSKSIIQNVKTSYPSSSVINELMNKDLCLTTKCTSSCTFNVQIRKRPVLELEIDDIEEMDAIIIIPEKNCLQMSGIIPKLQLDDLFL